jgi:3'-phosphoadenosine 5'-phosphosulfate sulfotransferase (PAPS reductase)/FAD synthetase
MTNVPGKRLSKEEVAAANQTLEKASPQEVLRWALSTFGRQIALAWSGAEDVAVLDMMHRLDPQATRVFTLDTGRLNAETYELIDEVQARYKIPIEIQFPARRASTSSTARWTTARSAAACARSSR